MYFDQSELLPADILVGRNEAPDASKARGIRSVLGSWSNHNALIVRSAEHGGYAVGDTTPPRAMVVSLHHYEDLVNAGTYKVRIYRVRDLSMDERLRISLKWYELSYGRHYSDYTLLQLALFRFVNHLPFRLPIRGTWCSENTARPFAAILPDDRNPIRKPDPPFLLKKNVTPRTYANRLECGILEDVTERTNRNDK